MRILPFFPASPDVEVVSITPFESADLLCIPFFESRIPAGFPSPADDHLDTCLDLKDLVVEHPAATFFARVEGDSMIEAGIHSGDVLVVDRALEPAGNRVVVAVIDGEFTVKRIKKIKDRLFLVPENADLAPMEVSPETEFAIWGVVTYVVHPIR